MPKRVAVRLASALAKFYGWAAHGTSSNDPLHTTSVLRPTACRSRGEAGRVTKPNFGSFQFACMVFLAVMFVFAEFLPPASPRAHDPSDETSAKVIDSPAEERLLRSKFSG